MANRIQTNDISCENAMGEMQELVKNHGDSRNFADALVEAVIAYYEFLKCNIDETSAQMRLRYGNDCYGKYINGVDINAN